VSAFPKRADLWSVYLDQEQRLADNELHIRRLLDRITSLSLSTKKMKYFFKRFLDFEAKFGSAATIEHVKQKARSYVESRIA